MQNGISKDERNWALIVHICALAGFAIPFGNIIVPLLIWMLKKDKLPFVNEQGKDVLNFQINITFYLFFSFVFELFLVSIGIIIFTLIMIVIAVVNIYKEKSYRYPLTIRIIK